MPVWIRADFDFGAPWVSFHIAHRQLVVDGLWPPENVAADADVMCRYAEECVRHYRPRLHNFSVVRMHADLYRATLVFDVVHPSFARVRAVQGPPTSGWTSARSAGGPCRCGRRPAAGNPTP